jgi:hypothetical protein
MSRLPALALVGLIGCLILDFRYGIMGIGLAVILTVFVALAADLALTLGRRVEFFALLVTFALVTTGLSNVQESYWGLALWLSLGGFSFYRRWHERLKFPSAP